MDTIWRIIIGVVIILVCIVGYERFGGDIRRLMFGQGNEYTIYVDRVAFSVSIADDEAERRQGLSGIAALPEYGGKLFIFDAAAKQGIWMKDMLMPIDILWFNDAFKLIHSEENVSPDSYPAIYAPPESSRFVLELNAYAIRSLGLSIGDTLVLPTALIPSDLKNSFQVR